VVVVVGAGNFTDIARQLLREVPLHAHKKSYAAKKYAVADPPGELFCLSSLTCCDSDDCDLELAWGGW
jgi:hypothetical protein